MLSKIMALIVAVVSFISNFAGLIPAKEEIYYNVSYGSYTRQVLDVAFPASQEEKSGVILFLHGGGWISGDKSSFTETAINMSRKTGCIAASMNYRYVSEKVDCEKILEDIDKALEKISSMAESRGIKTTKVMLAGFSAGAHLATLYAYTKKNTAPIKPAAVIAYSVPTDLSSKNFIEKNKFNTPEGMLSIVSKVVGEKITTANFNSKKSLIMKYSPINYVSSSCVPTIVAQGKNDAIVNIEDTKKFVSKLKKNSVTYQYFEYPNSAHSLNGDPDMTAITSKTFVEYVNKYVK